MKKQAFAASSYATRPPIAAEPHAPPSSGPATQDGPRCPTLPDSADVKCRSQDLAALWCCGAQGLLESLSSDEWPTATNIRAARPHGEPDLLAERHLCPVMIGHGRTIPTQHFRLAGRYMEI